MLIILELIFVDDSKVHQELKPAYTKVAAGRSKSVNGGILSAKLSLSVKIFIKNVTFSLNS
jgi:hypothetical protein